MSDDNLTPEQITEAIALYERWSFLGSVPILPKKFVVNVLRQLQESEECTRQLEELHERNKKEIQRLQAALKKYGRHLFHCVGEHSDSPDISLCTCGLKEEV